MKPNPDSLLSQVRAIAEENPAANTFEVFDRVSPNFPRDNPRWLRNRIHDYLVKLRSEKKALQSG